MLNSYLKGFVILLMLQWIASNALADEPAQKDYLEYTEDEIAGLKIKLTEDLTYVDVKANGKTIRIIRNQDPDHTVDLNYAKTARECPPFCIQPASIHPGVETIGALEMLDYLREASDGRSVLEIDSRTPDWRVRGTIPGSVSIPWTHIDIDRGSKDAPDVGLKDDIPDLFEYHFNVKRKGEYWDFRNAKTLVLFCNGYWCPQSPTNVRSLLALGYPEDKLKWFRGGLQEWEMLGLTTIVPEE